MKLLAEITDESLGLPRRERCPHRSIPRQAARAVLADGEGRIAVMALDKFDFYMLPGGGIEDGEDARTACIREMKEETGCDCVITGELGLVRECKSIGKHKVEETAYFIACVVGEVAAPAMEENEIAEGTRLEWHTPAEALRLVTLPVLSEPRFQHVRFMHARDAAALKEYMRKQEENIV